jgi:uncharacterized protein
VKADLADEPVASTDHVERMTRWCQELGPAVDADMEVLVPGALLHDVGVVINRKKHYAAGRNRAAEILQASGFPEDKIDAALHVLETHSRYGGPTPETTEAKVGQDADALEYIGAIGILRTVVRGLKDEVEGTFHTRRAEELGRPRLEYMKSFLDRIERELKNEA